MPETGHRSRLIEADMTGGEPKLPPRTRTRSFVDAWDRLSMSRSSFVRICDNRMLVGTVVTGGDCSMPASPWRSFRRRMSLEAPLFLLVPTSERSRQQARHVGGANDYAKVMSEPSQQLRQIQSISRWMAKRVRTIACRHASMADDWVNLLAGCRARRPTARLAPLRDSKGQKTMAASTGGGAPKQVSTFTSPVRQGAEPKGLLGGLPVAVYTTDATGKITYYNEAAAELWGRHPELGRDEFCGAWKLFWPDGTPLPHNECPMALSLKEKRPFSGMEAIVERPDGTQVRCIPHPTPLFDDMGNLTGGVNTVVDITDRY